MPFFDSDNRPALTPFGDQGPALRTFWGDDIMISLVDLQAGSVVSTATRRNRRATSFPEPWNSPCRARPQR